MKQRNLSMLVGLFLLTPAVQAANPENNQAADSSHKDTAGLGIGALIGGVLGGPVGAVAGAAGGAWLGGREAEKDQQRAELAGDLAARTAELEQLRSQLAAMEHRAERLQSVRLDRRRQTAAQLSEAINVAVYFRTDSSELKPEATARLQQLAGYLAEYPQIRVHIAGHADRRGTPDYNLKLSQRRAEQVAQVLARAGLDRDRLHVEAHGQADAEAQPGDIEGYLFDRRVNIALSLTDPV